MKKTLVAGVALAAALALTGCSSHGSGAAASPTPSVTTTPIDSYTQIHDLAGAITWAAEINPQTPNVDTEIAQTTKLLKKYIDASPSKVYSAANKKTLDAQLAQLQSDINAGKATDYIGGELATTAQAALQYLNK